MRLSPHRHTLAILRILLGLTQKEMADLIGCSRPTIQAIELGKLKMSDKLGGVVSMKTGISLHWLLRNDVTVEPTGKDEQKYTRKMFEEHQALLFAPAENSSDVRRNLFQVRALFRNSLERLAILLVHAYQNKNISMCGYKLDEAMNTLLEEGVGLEKLTPEEAERWKTLRLMRFRPEDLMAEVRRFVDQTNAIFQTEIADCEPPPPRGKHPESGHDLPPRLRKVWPKKTSAKKR